MNNGFTEITDTESLEQFLRGLNGTAAVLFKHSNSCGVSSRAYRELSTLESPVGLIVVQHSRTLSDEVGKRWDLAHETPQVLIVRDDKLAWNASHFEIRAEVVAEALRRIGDE